MIEEGVFETTVKTSGSTADKEVTTMTVQIISGSTQQQSQTVVIEAK